MTEEMTRTNASVAVFIISWNGMHENAAAIAHEALKATSNVSIVYSDPDPQRSPAAPCRLLPRPNDLFWEDKFKACLDASGNDPLLVIHADCRCGDWTALVKRCMAVHAQCGRSLGVWAPKIEGTYYHLGVSGLSRIQDSGLVLSALTDGIVFSLSPDIVGRMRQVAYGANPLGWGVDLLFCSASHVMDKWVVIDTGVEVFHPRSTGYDKKAARAGMQRFMVSFTLRERVQCELLLAYVHWNHAMRRGTLET